MLSALPVWAVQNGIDPGLAGTVMSVLLIVTVMTQLVSPPLMRRFTIRTLMVWGVALLGAPAILYPWAVTLPALYAVSALRGVGFGFLTVTAALAIQQAAPPGRQGEAIGFYGLAGAIPVTVGAAVGAGLTLSGHFIFVAIIASAPVLGILAASGVKAEVVPAAEVDGVPIAQALRRFLLPLGMLFVATAAGGAVVTLVPLQIPDSLQATVILIGFGSVAAVFRWQVGLYTDTHGHRWVAQILVAVGALGMGLTGVGFATASLGFLLPGVACAGIAYGALQSVSLDVTFQSVPRSQAPIASAAWNAFFDAGTAAGTAIFAALAATALQGEGAMMFGAGLFLLIGLLSVPSAMRLRRGK